MYYGGQGPPAETLPQVPWQRGLQNGPFPSAQAGPVEPQQQAAKMPMTAEAAAQYRNYGYGNAPLRQPGGHNQTRQHSNSQQTPNNFRNGAPQQAPPFSGLQGPPQLHTQNSPYPPGIAGNLPYSHGISINGTANPPLPPGPSSIPPNVGLLAQQHLQVLPSAGPPAKRARYESLPNAAHQPQAPWGSTIPQSIAQPMQLQPYYPSHQHSTQPPYQQYPPSSNFPPSGMPNPPILPSMHHAYPQNHPGQVPQNQIMAAHQQPMAFQPPASHAQYQQFQQPQQPGPPPSQIPGPPVPSMPLAVAPMKAAQPPYSHNNRLQAMGKGRSTPLPHASLPQPPPPPPSSTAPPPPPSSAAPPPPPPPSLPVPSPSSTPESILANSRLSTRTIKLSPKGAATLPPIPKGVSALPPLPLSSVPSPGISPGRRDTRPTPAIPASVSHHSHRTNLDTNSVGRGPGPGHGHGRGGLQQGSLRNGEYIGRGGRGARGGTDTRRNLAGRNDFHDNRSNNSGSSVNGYRASKRSFSQTNGGPPSGPSSGLGVGRNSYTRQRTDSASTITNLIAGGDVAGRHGSKRDRESNNRASSVATSRESTAALSNNKGLKRTLTDFRIESLEIVELGWKWKAMSQNDVLAEWLPVDPPEQDETKKVNPDEPEMKDSKENIVQLGVNDSDQENRSDREGSPDKKVELESRGILEKETDQEKHSLVTSDTVTDLEEETGLGGELGLGAEHDAPKELVRVAKAEALQDKDDTPNLLSTDLPGEDGLDEASLKLDKTDPEPAGAAPAMQRCDSRKEKRKHSEEEENHQTASDVNEDEKAGKTDKEQDQPLGKKVKSEGTLRSPKVSYDGGQLPAGSEESGSAAERPTDPGEQTSRASPTPSDSGHKSIALTAQDSASNEVSGQNDNVDEVSPEPQVDEPISAEEDESSSDSESSSGDEVAASVIAKPSIHNDAKPSDKPSSRIKESSRALNAQAASKEEKFKPPSLVKSLHQKNADAKKFRENSRLRIYFSSRIALDQKVVKKHASGRSSPQKFKRIRREKEVSRLEREDSVESRLTQPDQDPIEDGSDKEVEDDVDGIPIAQNGEDDADTDADGDGDAEAEAEDGKHTPLPSPLSKEVTVKSEEVEPDLPKTDSQIIAKTALSEDGTRLKNDNQPSADRISISYARNSRRLVINAENIEELTVHRVEAKIEIKIKLTPVEGEETDNVRYCRGVFLETVKHGNNFVEVDRNTMEKAWPEEDSAASVPAHPDQKTSSTSDQLLPPLHHLLVSSSSSRSEGSSFMSSLPTSVSPFKFDVITVIARMDRMNPLTEAKWVRTGNPDDWIYSVANGGLGNSSSSSNSAQLPEGESAGQQILAWKGKIRVIDPDAPPTFQHALENWLSASNTRNGFDEARYRFVSVHFQDVRHVLEVLLRLIRGVNERGSSSHYNNNSSNSNSSTTTSSIHGGAIGGKFPSSSHQTYQSPSLAAQAISSEAPYPEQQTPISLASYQLFKLGIEAALEAGVPRNDVDRKIGEVIRSLPYALIFKSLDSIFADFKRGKNNSTSKSKGGQQQ